MGSEWGVTEVGRDPEVKHCDWYRLAQDQSVIAECERNSVCYVQHEDGARTQLCGEHFRHYDETGKLFSD